MLCFKVGKTCQQTSIHCQFLTTTLLATNLPAFGSDTACMLIDREFPGEIEKIRTWFQDYKIPDGKPANVFGYDNKVCDSNSYQIATGRL